MWINIEDTPFALLKYDMVFGVIVGKVDDHSMPSTNLSCHMSLWMQEDIYIYDSTSMDGKNPYQYGKPT